MFKMRFASVFYSYIPLFGQKIRGRGGGVGRKTQVHFLPELYAPTY
jgi:hypothetical protein